MLSATAYNTLFVPHSFAQTLWVSQTAEMLGDILLGSVELINK
jgi:hypothetical protein